MSANDVPAVKLPLTTKGKRPSFFDDPEIEARIKASCGVFKGRPGARWRQRSCNSRVIAWRWRSTRRSRASPQL